PRGIALATLRRKSAEIKPSFCNRGIFHQLSMACNLGLFGNAPLSRECQHSQQFRPFTLDSATKVERRTTGLAAERDGDQALRRPPGEAHRGSPPTNGSLPPDPGPAQACR